MLHVQVTTLLAYRLSGLPRDADEKVIQEVGAATETQHGVGKLEGEVSGLAQLTSCKKIEREKIFN